MARTLSRVNREAVRARFGEQIAYLCCSACMRKRVDAGHWSTVRGNLAKAQQKCPVMDGALPEKAEPVVIEGRLIYICCPPCAETIAGDPPKHFRAVDAPYAAHLEAEQAERAGQAPPHQHGGQHDHAPPGHGGGCGGCSGSHSYE